MRFLILALGALGVATWTTTIGGHRVVCGGARSLSCVDRSRSHGPSWASSYDAVSRTTALAVRGPVDFSGRRQHLLITHDGGRHWHRVRSPCPPPMAALRGISFPTRGHGWLLCVGEPGVGAEEKGVYTTTDLGRHWLPVAESRFLRHIDFGGLGVGGYPAGISFLADGHGILWESRGTLFVTHDGGHHWFPKSKAVRPQVDVGLWGEMVKPRYALVLLDGLNGHRVIMSSDAGRTWRIAHRWMR